MQLPNCGIGTDRPVRLALLAWAGIGLTLTGYGVYDMYTYRCPTGGVGGGVGGGGGCGDPFGFVFVLWGLAIVGVVTIVVLGRFAFRRFRRSGGRADG